MARPRKDEAGPSAKDRLEEAFWLLLEEVPYKDITVRALTERARVNHNTFYYHFENIDEMALNLTSKNVPHELVELVSSLIKGQDIATKFGDFANNAGLELRFKRLQLLLRHGGSQLIELGKRRIVPQCLSILGVDINALSAADRARMTFMMGGVIALISSEEVGSFAHYLELLQSGIADAAAALWRQMGKD